MTAVLSEPEKANLLALILHRLLARSPAALPSGVFRLRAGGMVARVSFGRETRVEGGEGPADCSMEGELHEFLRLALGGAPIRAWLGGAVRVRGNPLRALAFLKVLRCKP